MPKFLNLLLILLSLLNAIGIAGILIWRWPTTAPSKEAERAKVEIPERPNLANVAPSSPNASEIQRLRNVSLNIAEMTARRFPTDVNSLCLLAKLHLRMGNAKGAIQIWKSLIDSKTDAAEPYLDLAFYEQKMSNHEAAVTLLQQAIERESQRNDLYMPLVESLLALNKSDDAVEWLERLLKVDVNDPVVWNRLGQAYVQSNKLPQAIAAFEESLSLDPFLRDAAFGLMDVYRSLKDEPQVSRLTEKIAFIDQTFPRLAPEDERADPDLTKARSLAAFTCTTVLEVLDAKRDSEFTAVAIEQLVELASDVPTLKKNVLDRYARTQSSQNVLRFLQHQCDQTPDDTEAWLALGRFAIQIRDLDRAETSLRKAIELKPDDPIGYSLLSQVLMPSNRNPKLAVEYAQKAADLSPTSAHFYLLATAHYHQNERDKAKSLFAKAIELNPANNEAVDALEALENQK